MIFEALQLLVLELNQYLNSIDNQSDDVVVLGNIAQLDSQTGGGTGPNSLLNKVVLTLINIEEEKTLKNIPNYKVINDISEYQNAQIHLNLYILISTTSTSYENALKYLSRVLRFFQGKTVFTQKNSPLSQQPGIGLEDFKLILDLYSPTFEEANFLWSTLGGKQLPSVIYKVRMVQLLREQMKETRSVIVKTNISKKVE